MKTRGVEAYRHYWGERRGALRLTLNWDVIDQGSHVFVAASEGELQRSAGRGPVPPFLFVGAARITVHNVAPNDGYVVVYLMVDWRTPLPIFVDYLVVNP